jgi:hypothetical protein
LEKGVAVSHRYPQRLKPFSLTGVSARLKPCPDGEARFAQRHKNGTSMAEAAEVEAVAEVEVTAHRRELPGCANSFIKSVNCVKR